MHTLIIKFIAAGEEKDFRVEYYETPDARDARWYYAWLVNAPIPFDLYSYDWTWYTEYGP